MLDVATVYVVEVDTGLCELLRCIAESVGLRAETFANAGAFLDAYDSSRLGCLVLDASLPDMTGLELQRSLTERGIVIPIIMLSGRGDVPLAVKAMQARAFDVLEKPLKQDVLLDRIRRAVQLDAQFRRDHEQRQKAIDDLARLTVRERQVFALVAEGTTNKQIAARLGICEKTVELHRTKLKRKLRATSVAALVQISLLAKPPGDHSYDAEPVRQLPKPHFRIGTAGHALDAEKLPNSTN